MKVRTRARAVATSADVPESVSSNSGVAERFMILRCPKAGEIITTSGHQAKTT